jgi:hypothetical protein
MSTPSDRLSEPLDPNPYAPKWARHSARGLRGPVPHADDDPGIVGRTTLPAARPANDDYAHEKEDLVIGNVRVPPSFVSRTLDPTPVPDPRQMRKRLRASPSRLRIVGRVVMAATVASAAACYWVGVIPSPSNADTERTFASLAGMLPGGGAEPLRGERRPLDLNMKIQDRAPAAWPGEASDAAAPTPVTKAAEKLAAAAPLVGAPPPSAERPAVAEQPPPAEPAVRQLAAEEIAMLLKRGEEFVEAGDFASARPVLQRAAEAGNSRAALILAGTFDPAVMQKVHARGLAPDIAKAKYWYVKARDLGSPEAQRQLARLADRPN